MRKKQLRGIKGLSQDTLNCPRSPLLFTCGESVYLKKEVDLGCIVSQLIEAKDGLLDQSCYLLKSKNSN